MAELRQLGQSAPLSASLPNVSLSSNRQQSPAWRPTQLSPLPDYPFISYPTKSPNTNYSIDDDAWADTADPVTGSVFYIEPSIPSRCSLVPSSSSSSLSSSPPMSEFMTPSSPTAAHYGKERFSTSVQLPPPESPKSLEEFTSSLSSSLSRDSGSEKPRSLRKKLQKMINVGEKKSSHIESESMTDLNQFHSDSGVHVDMSQQIPQGSQYGSRGTPLHHAPTSSPLIGYPTKVEMDLCQFQLGAEGMPCSLEKLGIVPARSLSKWKFGSLASLRFKTHYPPLSPSVSQPVVIRGLVPGYPAAVATQLRPGDTVISVNHHAVNMDNIDSVLSTLSNKIHFLIKKGHSRQSNHSTPTLISSPPPPSPHMSSSGSLVRLVTGGRGPAPNLGPRKQRGLFHLLLYVTLDTKEDDPPDKDILFKYSKVSESEEGEAKMLEQLVRIRGAFLTLSDVLATVTSSPSISNSSVLLDGKLVHVSCIQIGKELLLIALPTELTTQYQLQLFLETVNSAISLLFGSIYDAFTTSRTRSSVDHLLGLLFESVLSQPSIPGSSSSSPLLPCSPLLGIPALPRLKVSTDIKMKLDAVLSGLESCDHSNRPEMLHVRRPFVLTGSCLVHRGALACSHLTSEEQRDVALFCHAYHLLELTASDSVSQIIIWKEVFSSEAREHQKMRHPVNRVRRKRTFLLAVGLEQTLLCMLMQQVAAPSISDVGVSPSVDAVYVDRGRALLLELRAQDLLNFESTESEPLPALTSADIVVHSVFRRTSQPLITSVSNLATNRSRKVSDPFGLGKASAERSDSEDEEEVTMVIGRLRRRSQSMLHLKPHFRQRKPPHKSAPKGFSSNNELPGKKSVVTPRPPYTLTSGQDNLLLHYVDLEAGHGLMLCPTQATPPGNIHSELLKSFQLTCAVVRKVLRGGRGEGEDGVESESESDDWDSDEEVEGKAGEPKATQPFRPKASSVIEHGVLWKCGTSSLKTVASMHYWVIGRYYVEADRELYICCQETISQNTVEMAFRLLFGWPG